MDLFWGWGERDTPRSFCARDLYALHMSGEWDGTNKTVLALVLLFKPGKQARHERERDELIIAQCEHPYWNSSPEKWSSLTDAERAEAVELFMGRQGELTILAGERIRQELESGAPPEPLLNDMYCTGYGCKKLLYKRAQMVPVKTLLDAPCVATPGIIWKERKTECWVVNRHWLTCGSAACAEGVKEQSSDGGGKERQRCCEACGRPEAKRRCARCHGPLYCNVACQAEHYEEHKSVCKRAATQGEYVPPAVIDLRKPLPLPEVKK